jgi:hypothetical protein
MVDCTLSRTVANFETHAEDEHLLVQYGIRENAAAWDRLTDLVIEWPLRCPENVDEDGIEWPSRSVLTLAYQLACNMRNSGVQVPSNIVPNGEGGVVFEWRAGPYYVKIEVDKDSSSEYLAFNSGTLVSRRPLSLA